MDSRAPVPITRYAQLAARPWKNGQGITRTLCSDSTGIDDSWTWKISIAEITGTQPYKLLSGSAARANGVRPWLS
ncbi:HutD family protein [Glutamicibacter sp. JL.03c]|uniref:HutD family protein n=1 Tax=Glutamicibacter sp. JL.03c TaxID=2984842 RepID=UPI0039AF5933